MSSSVDEAKSRKVAQRREKRRNDRLTYQNSEEGKVKAAEKAERSEKLRKEKHQRYNAKRALRNIVIEDESDISQLSVPQFNLRSNAIHSEEDEEDASQSQMSVDNTGDVAEESSQAQSSSNSSLPSTPVLSLNNVFITTPVASQSQPSQSQIAATPAASQPSSSRAQVTSTPAAYQPVQVLVTPVSSRRPSQSSSAVRKRRSREMQADAQRKEKEDDLLSQINQIGPVTFHVSVAEKELQKLHRNLEYHCFNDGFLQPVSEPPILLRQKQLFRLRFHRRGNDPETDEGYKHYKMREVYPVLVDNFLNGNYPNLTMSTPLSQCDTPNQGLGHEEYDEIDAEVMQDVYIRLCDPMQCPTLSDENILGYNEVLVNILHHLKERRFQQALDSILETYPRLNNLMLMDFLRVYYNCYTGVRTAYNKINMIRSCLNVILAESPVSYNDLPTFVKHAVCKTMEKEAVEADMTSTQALRRFGPEYDAFEATEDDIEVYPCEICARLNCKRYLSSKLVDFDRNWLPAQCSDKDRVMACKQCIEDLKAEKKPRYALTNGFLIDPLPDCFKELNFLEKNLIQQVHPIIGVYSVVDHRGVGTGMRGKNGTCTFHAVPLDATTGIISKSLPDARGLKILVQSEKQGFEPTLVNIEKVVRCLFYLKRRNDIYKDITIDQQFHLNNDVLQINPAYNVCATAKTDSLLILEDASVIGTTTRQYGNVVRQDSTAPTNFQRYVMQQHKYDPLKYDHKDLDAKCVPWLLPTGQYGWDFPRENEVSFTFYNRARLRNENRQFATDPLYVLLVAGITEQYQLQSSISLALRQSKMKFTCGDVLRMINSKKFEDHILFSSMLSDIRGYAPYWSNVKKLLRAHVQVFGPPTWWLTFNPDLRRWVKLHESYATITGEAVDESNIYQYVAKDPLIFQRFFHRRLRAIWRFLHSDAAPVGKVIHSFKRIEYQLGGLDHAHCFLWIKGAPTKSSTSEEICSFIDKYVSVKKPSPDQDPFLADVVEDCQMHDDPCRDTCKREEVVDGKQITYCRFEFPRETCGKTHLRSEFNSYGKNTRRLYSVARTDEERHVNDYNVPLLSFWNANMDIQFLLDGVPTVINYAVDYSLKDEGYKNSLFDKKQHELVQTTDLFKIGVDLMKRKKMPITEALDIIMGEPLYEFDAGHIFINLHADEDRKRIVVGEKLLNTMPATSRAYKENPIDDYYAARPDELEDTSLCSFMIAWGIEYYAVGADGRPNTKVPAKNARGRRSDDDFIVNDGSIADESYSNGVYVNSKYHPRDPYSPFYDYRHLPKGHVLKLKTGGKEIVKLPRMLVPDIYLKAFKPGDEKSREDFYRRLCMLFIPWRKEESLKSFFAQQGREYETRWVNYYEDLKLKSERAYNDIQQYLDQHLAYFEEERRMFDQRPKRPTATSSKSGSNTSLVLNFDRGEVDEIKLKEEIAALKPDQRPYFDEIMANIEQTPDPQLRIFLSGSAGTGKSEFLNVLDKALTAKYTPSLEDRMNSPAVIKVATTGAAARNINGFTIHTFLGIGIDQYNLLSDARKDALRNQLKNIKLIMIDEISMCSNELLAKISLRLQEITERNIWFGGISVIMTGDLLQLPPVQEKFCFEVLQAASLKRLIECSADEYDLWNSMEIQYMELTEIKRQDDPQFGEVLSRARIGQLSDDDVEYISDRVLPIPEGTDKVDFAIETYRDISINDKTVICLYSTNAEVDALNEKMLLTHFKDELVIIRALKYEEADSDDDEDEDVEMSEIKPKVKFTRIYQESRYKLVRVPKDCLYKPSKETKRKLDKALQQLVVAPGVRVMLTRNMDLSKKLVNGSMGTVDSITYDKEDSTKVLAIVVAFDGIPELVSISRITITIDKPYSATRRYKHFPLKVAFAATIHITQGQSLTSAIISLERVFAPGQAYVALSRLTTLEGLHLLDCPRRVFCCDTAALNEQNKLRTSIGLPAYHTSAVFVPRTYAKIPCLKLATPTKHLDTNGTLPTTTGTNPIIVSSTPPIPTTSPKTLQPTRALPISIAPPLLVQPTSSSIVVQPTPTIPIPTTPPLPLQRATPQHLQRRRQVEESVVPLRNLGNDCFLIAAVNLIYFAGELKESIIQNAHVSGRIQAELVRILQKNITQARTLRQAIPAIAVPQGAAPIQEATGRALSLLQEALDDASDTLYRLHYGLYATCMCDNGQPRMLRNETSGGSVTFRAIHEVNLFEELKEAWLVETVPSCTNCRHPMEKRYHLNVSNLQRYLFVEVNAYTNSRNKRQVILGDTDIDNFDFGASWKLIGMAEHIGQQSGGHYKAWRRTAYGWIVVSDDTYQETNALPHDISCFNVLLFERNV